MTELEYAITSTLRADAQEAAMTTDTAREAQKLDARLDAVDRTRRRRTWIGAVAAVAAVALVAAGVWVLGLLPGGKAAPPASPVTSASPNFTSSSFVVPLALRLPDWAEASAPSIAASRMISWEQSVCARDCPAGSDRKLRIMAPVALWPADAATTQIRMPDYAGYLAYLQRLPASFGVGPVAQATVGGRPATFVTISPTSTVEGSIGCESMGGVATDCYGLIAGMSLRMAIVDTPGGPLLLWERANGDSPQLAAVASEFETTTSTVSFGTDVPAPSSSASTAASGVQGVWRTSFTKADVLRVLKAAGLDSSFATVTGEGFNETSTFQLDVDGAAYKIRLVKPDGSLEDFDGQAYTLSGDTLTADPENKNGTRTVFTVSVQGQAMTWAFVSDESPELAPGVPDEAIQRALYTTGVWTRVS